MQELDCENQWQTRLSRDSVKAGSYTDWYNKPINISAQNCASRNKKGSPWASFCLFSVIV
ncbi:hypothetical protein TUM4644_18990 [Shewanella colwelliana]|nr:hypothetical protein TUM4644_18990 [Shewanella colwelliana]